MKRSGIKRGHGQSQERPGKIPQGHQGECIQGEPQAPLSSCSNGMLGCPGNGGVCGYPLLPPPSNSSPHPAPTDRAGCGSRCPISRREPRGGGSCPLKPPRCGCTPNLGVALPRILPAQLDPAAVQGVDLWGSQWDGFHVRAKGNLRYAPRLGGGNAGLVGELPPQSLGLGARGIRKPLVSAVIYPQDPVPESNDPPR